MFNRDKLLKAAQSDEDKLFLSKAYDRATVACERGYTTYFGFLDLRQQKFISTLFLNAPVSIQLYGGFEEAERKISAFFQIEPERYEYPITVLEVKSRELKELSHRDFLGSLMGLGIKRDKIGDILIGETAQIIVMQDIAEYILQNFNKVGNKGISVSYFDGECVIPEKNEKQIRDTVASLRLDSIIASAFGVSRTNAAKLISQQRVMVDHETVTETSFMLKGGEVLSARGFGKAKFIQTVGKSRKDRFVIEIKKYL